jgi:neutral ceramidase
MKCTLPFLVSVVFLALPGRAADGVELRAGASAVDITPTAFPLNMPGGFEANMAQSVHDPLFARGLVLYDGVTALGIVVVDNLGVAEEVADEAKALASQRCGIPVDKMLVASTHTHSAPASNVQEGPEPAVAYRKVLVAGIAESIAQAHAALRPAEVGAAAYPLPDEVFNRRWFLKPGKMTLNPFGRMDLVKMNPGTTLDILDWPAGPTDPEITILSVQDAQSHRPLALLANYSLHYVGGVPPAIVSADYFGEFARLMRSRLGGDERFVAMMSNGTSGDINNIPFLVNRPPREPFEQIRIVAQKAADAAWHAQAGMANHRSDMRLGMLQRRITVQVRRPTEAELAEAQAVLALTDQAALDALPPLAAHYAQRVIALAKGPDTLTVTVQALQLGDLAVCTIPFETFVEIGLDLKERSPFPRTMVMGIANGYNGYLPTPEQHKLGGYETWLGTNRVQEDASVILTNNLLDMLSALRRGD